MEQKSLKQGEQLLKSGGHSASLDKTNKCRGQCEQLNFQVVTKPCNIELDKYKLDMYVPQQKYRPWNGQ